MSLYLDLKSLIVKSGFSIKSVNDQLNLRNGTDYSFQNLSRKIRRETLRYSEVEEILDVIGYEIIWAEKE